MYESLNRVNSGQEFAKDTQRDKPDRGCVCECRAARRLQSESNGIDAGVVRGRVCGQSEIRRIKGGFACLEGGSIRGYNVICQTIGVARIRLRARVRERALPETTITPSGAERAARARATSHDERGLVRTAIGKRVKNPPVFHTPPSTPSFSLASNEITWPVYSAAFAARRFNLCISRHRRTMPPFRINKAEQKEMKAARARVTRAVFRRVANAEVRVVSLFPFVIPYFSLVPASLSRNYPLLFLFLSFRSVLSFFFNL